VLLTAIVFLPLAGAVIVGLLPKAAAPYARWVAALFAAVDLAFVGLLVTRFDVRVGIQRVTDVPWVPQAAIRFHVGVDGVALAMLVLSALLGLLGVIASWKVSDRPKAYFALLLLLQVGMNGVFVALDFVLFYVFWELVLVPMFFLIGLWGGERREYASVKFFLYTLFGSVFMLVAIIALYLATGTFDLVELAEVGRGLPLGFQWWVFGAFFLGFAVKVPIWPLHTWLPDAHVEAPTTASVLLAGILLKMGAYGFIRIALPILPKAFLHSPSVWLPSWQTVLAVLAVISIVYGAAVALAQTDLKKLVAYSSVSHMGFVMLGIASGTVDGIDGAVAVMFSHGIVTGMLFFLVGMIYERTHTRAIADVSGLSTRVPVLGGLLAFASFASLGLPGLSGFVGEFLSLVGSWRSAAVPHWLTVVAAIGVLLAAAYTLWMVQRVVLGRPSAAVTGIPDASRIEVVTLAPLIVLTVVVGVYWDSILRYVDPVARTIVAVLEKA
jgi:NADH-quinone oxidoreductase subunit M